MVLQFSAPQFMRKIVWSFLQKQHQDSPMSDAKVSVSPAVCTSDYEWTSEPAERVPEQRLQESGNRPPLNSSGGSSDACTSSSDDSPHAKQRVTQLSEPAWPSSWSRSSSMSGASHAPTSRMAKLMSCFCMGDARKPEPEPACQKVTEVSLTSAAARTPSVQWRLCRLFEAKAPIAQVVQASDAARVKASASITCQLGDEQTEALLQRLWSAAFPSVPYVLGKTSQWKEMGWQGSDPTTDLRGCGRLGLECLVYLAEQHPAIFRRLLDKAVGQRSDWEYPFAAAGVNVAFMLLSLLEGSGSKQGKPSKRASRAAKGLEGLLASDSCAFEEVFVAAFEHLDAEWLRQGASYMQFSNVLKATQQRTEAALSKRPKTLQAIRALLA